MTFVSKKDLWIRPIFVVSMALIAGSAYRIGIEYGLNGYSVFQSALFIFMAWVYWGTYYRIENDILIAKCGPFKWTIDIGSIKSVVATTNPLSSPALSLDRLEITYGKGRKIRLSPLDKNGFVTTLTQMNPEIQFIGD